MDIQLLSNFLVVAREGNITKAAKLVDLGFLVPARGKTMPCDQEQSEQQGCAQHRAQQYDLVAGQVNIACDDSV